jgi:3-oxo-5-alpha-steroid 4-dehydrogenase 1
MFVIGLPVYFANVYDGVYSPLVFIGMLVFITGYMIEVLADTQLKKHIKTNPGILMTSGLWSYSRHPNYLGEMLLWWGLYLTSLSLGSPLYLFIGPLAISYVLYFISTPLLEERMKQKEGWDTYAKVTNKFFFGRRPE